MSRPASSFRRSALLSSLAGLAVSVFGFLPLMGLPGAVATALAMPLIGLMSGGAPDSFPGQGLWPFVLAVTLLLGPLVPVTWLATRLAGLSGWGRAAAVAAGLVAGSVIVAAAAYAALVRPVSGAP